MPPKQGEYVVDLYTNGIFFKSVKRLYSDKTFREAVEQWVATGYDVKITREPKK